MLYSDPAGSIEHILYDGAGAADAETTDEYGVLHRLWKVSDPNVINLLTTAMADQKLIIADGHHRYETRAQLLQGARARVIGQNRVQHRPTASTALSRSRCDE